MDSLRELVEKWKNNPTRWEFGTVEKLCETLDNLPIAAVQTQGWKPIAAAPKDGTRVIMGFTKDENGYTMPSCEGFFNRKLVIPEWVWMAAPHSPLCPQPTHFMDMPEPPKETV